MIIKTLRMTEEHNEFGYLSKVSPEYIKSLPLNSFQGTIHLIDNYDSVNEVYHLIKNKKVLGFDTETRPSFKKGRVYKLSLLQLATDEHAFLYRLNKIGIPDYIIDIFEDEEIVKAGVAIKNDIKSLTGVRDFQPAGFVELQEFVKYSGIEDNGLKKIVANVLGFRISKRSQTSNWEQNVLSPEQLQYAATDAWTCYEIYRKLDTWV